ncbi:MAG: creatininase family protein [Ignavibacteriae bacterium]|nr:creatininase family protein [Ignavibacteriota bacterium]
MSQRPFLLKETNWKNVKETEYKVAVLPWGATEAHNYHLPYGTDIYETEKIAEVSAKLAWGKGAKVIVLPVIPFGVNTQQLDIKLTINMNPSTQAIVLKDIVESLENHKIEKLVVLNGHGGNDFKQMIRELQKDSEIFITTLNWFGIGNDSKYFENDGDHAHEMETSLMLYAFPELVLPLEDAGDGVAKSFRITALKEKWAWAPREWTKVTDDTGVGNPKAATAEKGEKYFNYLTKKISQFIVELNNSSLSDMYE